MFDVFERTCETLSPWLLALFDFEYGEFTTRLTFVVSGRDPLEQHWTELAGALCRVPLEPFMLDETRLYLSNQDIIDERLVTQIHSDTGGLPVLVELLAATRPQPGAPLADISKDAVERFLQWTPQEERRQAALLAAVPRQFNRDILSAALGSDATGMFNWLTAQSYIRTSTERGWFYHEKVRELMLRYLQHTAPSDLAATHARLKEFFEKAQEQLHLAEKAAYDSETWCDAEAERLYHATNEQPDRNIVIAVNAFFHAFRWGWGFAEQIVQVCRQVSQETKLHATQEISVTLAVLHDAVHQNSAEIVIEKLKALEVVRELPLEARSSLHALRGRSYEILGRTVQALADFDRAIGLDETNAWAIANRGQTYRLMGRYELALADLDHAVALDPVNAEFIKNRGHVYFEQRQFDRALADFSVSLSLNSNDLGSTFWRGLSNANLGNLDQALEDLDRVVATGSTNAVMFEKRAEILLRKGRPREALADLNRALTLWPDYGNALKCRSDVYLELGLLDQSLADLNTLIAVNSTDTALHYERGIFLGREGRFTEALDDFEAVVTLDPSNAFGFSGRGETYLNLGQNNQALADFNRAPCSRSRHAYFLYCRGLAFRLLGQESLAAVELAKAIARMREAVTSKSGDAKSQFELALVELAAGNLENSTSELPSGDRCWS